MLAFGRVELLLRFLICESYTILLIMVCIKSLVILWLRLFKTEQLCYIST